MGLWDVCLTELMDFLILFYFYLLFFIQGGFFGVVDFWYGVGLRLRLDGGFGSWG